MTVSADMPLVGCVLTLSLLVLLIFMAAKGLRYQALMTSLNGVRFSFNCSLKGFWWVTFFLPILMAIGMGTVFFISTKMLHANSSSSVIISVVLGNDSNLLIVFYVQIMPDDFVMQLHRF